MGAGKRALEGGERGISGGRVERGGSVAGEWRAEGGGRRAEISGGR